jgi:hypothetical protein
MSLEPETHSLLSNVKTKKEATKALRLFEVYNPDTVNKALKQQILVPDRTVGQINKFREFLQAKDTIEREHAKIIGDDEGRMFEDDVTLQRRGRRHCAPYFLKKYHKKLQDMKRKGLSNTLGGNVMPNFKAAIAENESCDELGTMDFQMRISPGPLPSLDSTLPSINLTKLQSTPSKAGDSPGPMRRVSSIYSEYQRQSLKPESPASSKAVSIQQVRLASLIAERKRGSQQVLPEIKEAPQHPALTLADDESSVEYEDEESNPGIKSPRGRHKNKPPYAYLRSSKDSSYRGSVDLGKSYESLSPSPPHFSIGGPIPPCPPIPVVTAAHLATSHITPVHVSEIRALVATDAAQSPTVIWGGRRLKASVSDANSCFHKRKHLLSDW